MTRAERAAKAFARDAGYRRKMHFAAGGTTTAWRGNHRVYTDRKKEAQRRACRGREE